MIGTVYIWLVFVMSNRIRHTVCPLLAALIWGLANGYTFEALNESSPGCTARPAN